MNDVFSFGSYYPGESPLHRLDPRAKLTLAIVFFVMCMMTRSPLSLAFIAAFVGMLYAISGVPAGKAIRSLLPLLGLAVIVALVNLLTFHSGPYYVQFGIIQISEGSLRLFFFTGARVTLMMMGMSLMTLTTPTLELTEAAEHMMAPFARFGLPAHELGMIMGITLRFLPQFVNEWVTVYRAQISRGAAVKEGALGSARMLVSLIIPLFTSAFRHAETLSAAMDARCYHGGAGRTKLHPMHYTRLDAIAAAVVAVLTAAVAAVNIL